VIRNLGNFKNNTRGEQTLLKKNKKIKKIHSLSMD